MSVSSSLLFDHCLWLLLLMPCLGLILTYFTKRTKPYRKNGKIYRHDVAARVEHWPHALGTLFLLISGIIMGLSFFISFIFDERRSGNCPKRPFCSSVRISIRDVLLHRQCYFRAGAYERASSQ